MDYDYIEKIDLIHNLLITSDAVNEIVRKINTFINKKNILDIGSILYEKGKTINNCTLFPYDIFIKSGTYDKKDNSSVIGFKIAITYGIEDDSINYSSNFFPKEPIKIRKGIVLIGNGKYLYDRRNIELYKNKIDFMVWNTKLDLQELKDKVVFWESSPIQNLNEQVKKPIFKDCVYKKYTNIYFETHHIDNNGNNNMDENLLWVTMEQHAAIHLFMWRKYEIEKSENNYNFLINNYKRKTHFV